MRTNRRFATITVEGGLLPADFLERLLVHPGEVPGTRPEDYYLEPNRRLRDAINRSWTELQGVWSAFVAERERLQPGDHATTLTRERWLLPLFNELCFGRLQRSDTITLQGRDYPISHAWGHVPVHLLGAGVELDRRSRGIAGAASAAPFSMLQDLLNRSEDRLWGMLSNGRRLRLLRRSPNLTRLAYVEFDLEAMFSGEVFADFALLWMVCHVSRFDIERPEHCWLERWLEEAKVQGVRARDRLRRGFEQAITALGRGFLDHPANATLRARLRSGELTPAAYQHQLLRLVYRLVFLLVAEDRDLLHLPGTPDDVRQRYARYYSVGRLRDLARTHRGTRHVDLYTSLRRVVAALGQAGIPALGVPTLGSFLWSTAACPDLDGAELANVDLLAALRALAYTEAHGSLQRVDFANLGSEELGSVYESLLELHPRIEADAARFELDTAAGNERKSTGSYYTPSSLIGVLLDATLEPVLDEAIAQPNPREALLSLTVLDPACGSGHFLTAAAHRIATRLAALETGELVPGPEAVRHALREVVSRCIYGIDLNPMAIELAKVNLWLESVEPGTPLSFLDHHLVCGNALVGATPRLIAEGIPDGAFEPIEGDDKAIAQARKRANASDRRQRQRGLGRLEIGDAVLRAVESLGAAVRELDLAPDTTTEDLHAKEARWAALQGSPEAQLARLVANAWCAAFFEPKTPESPELLDSTLRTLAAGYGDRRLLELIEHLVAQHRFLHPHLAFPDLLVADPDSERDWRGGFDVVIGNPPWEKIQLSEQEFFASRRPDIAAAPEKRRQQLIAELEDTDPALWAGYHEALRNSQVVSRFLHGSGRYPLCGRGRVNTYAVFAEAMRSFVSPQGRIGMIVPTGIATDLGTEAFFRAVSAGQLIALYEFQNRDRIFPAVTTNQRFCLLILAGSIHPGRQADLVFDSASVEDVSDPERHIRLAPEELTLINPNTHTLPIFRSRRDADLTLSVHRRIPILCRADPPSNSWSLRFDAMFNMTTDASRFRERDDLERHGFELDGAVFCRDAETFLPLYEGKMFHHFDHRWGSFTGKHAAEVSASAKADPNHVALPRYWVATDAVAKRLEGWPHGWLLGCRDVAGATNERTLIAVILPRTAAGNSLTLLLSDRTPHEVACLTASLSSLALDYIARQKVGGVNVNLFNLQQFPVLPPATYHQLALWDRAQALIDWLTPRVLELTYTAWDLAGFARELGWQGPPFVFDESRRALLRAELDACFFHLYGMARDDVEHVLESFLVLARREHETLGEYRTQRLVLERYDAMANAIETRSAYHTDLDPPPADPRVAHRIVH